MFSIGLHEIAFHTQRLRVGHLFDWWLMIVRTLLAILQQQPKTHELPTFHSNTN